MQANISQLARWTPGLRPWTRLSPSSRRLITMSALLLQILVVAVSVALYKTRELALQDARQTAENLSIAIAGHTSTSLQGIDLVLRGMQSRIDALNLTTPQAFRAALRTEAEHQTLQQAGSGVSQVQAFAIIGADGRLINGGGTFPVPAVDYARAAFYQYLKTHDDRGAYLSRPLYRAGRGRWTMFVLRRVDGPSGQFLGLLAGAVDLDYFASFYHSLAGQSGLTVTLLNRGGDIIASYPPIPVTGHALMPASKPYLPWLSIVASGHPGWYEAPGVLSPGMRLNVVNPLRDYPLVVSIGISEADVLADWRKESWIAAGGTAVAMLCVFLMLHALARQLQRLEASEAALAAQNTALVKVEGAISHLANHDDLTGLSNRRAFHEFLDQAIARANRSRSSLAVLCLDLDRFKIANDTRGHEFGDKLLTLLAARLGRMVGPGDTVARTGGDEFALLRPVMRDPAELTVLARNLLTAVDQSFEIEGTQYRIGMSIGIACYPAHGAHAGDLLRNADIALYQAKSDGGNVSCTFDESMNARQQALYAIEQGLRQALELQQFELNYQPIVTAASGKIIACEALLRWRHPERGLIPPMDFIGLAEHLGLIIPIGYWVFEAACAEAATWPAAVSITVNVSPVQFRDDNLPAKLSEILQRTQLAAGRLVLEITEGVLLEDSSHVLGIMNRLRGLGVHFSLDDFGTGHSGLGYLRHFPFDAIKIDKIFIRDMEHKAEARAIITALLTVATALELDVIAEGIENGAQLAALRHLGCLYVQGYFMGRPQNGQDIRPLLRENHMESLNI